MSTKDAHLFRFSRNFTVATASALLLLGGPALMGQSDTRVGERPAEHSTASTDALELVSASTQYGFDVAGSDGKRLGDISDHAVDLKNGTIAYTLISSGGIFGVGGEVRAVPSDSITWEDGRYTASISQREFEDLEPVGGDLESFLKDPETRDQAPRQTRSEQQSSRSGELTSVSSHMDRDVNLESNAYFGEVQDVLLSPSENRVAFVEARAEGPQAGMISTSRDAFNRFLLPVGDIAEVSEGGLDFDLSLGEIQEAQSIAAAEDVERGASQRGQIYVISMN